MADSGTQTSQSTQSDQDQSSSQQGQQSQQGQGQQSMYDQPRSVLADPSFDSSHIFEQMTSGFGAVSPSGGQPAALDWTNQITQHYFDALERESRHQRETYDEQIRATRKVVDLCAQQLILQQTVSQLARHVAPMAAQVATQQVISYLRQNPEQLKWLIQGSQSQSSSSSR